MAPQSLLMAPHQAIRRRKAPFSGAGLPGWAPGRTRGWVIHRLAPLPCGFRSHHRHPTPHDRHRRESGGAESPTKVSSGPIDGTETVLIHCFKTIFSRCIGSRSCIYSLWSLQADARTPSSGSAVPSLGKNQGPRNVILRERRDSPRKTQNSGRGLQWCSRELIDQRHARWRIPA